MTGLLAAGRALLGGASARETRGAGFGAGGVEMGGSGSVSTLARGTARELPTSGRSKPTLRSDGGGLSAPPVRRSTGAAAVCAGSAGTLTQPQPLAAITRSAAPARSKGRLIASKR